jgi:hypothetical protein
MPMVMFFSGYQLVQTALDLKQEYTGEQTKPGKPPFAQKRHEFWDVPPVWIFST